MASLGLLTEGRRLLVGVSGGGDSMVLLALLEKIGGPLGWQLVAAHFNHQLRGEESDADEALVTQVSRERGLRLLIGRGAVADRAKEQGISFEMAARDARHAFFARCARDEGLSEVCLAHHADDQVELFLIRLLRGAGSEGLGGMKPLSQSAYGPETRLVRPLLSVSKEQLIHYGKVEKIAYREDSSNRTTDAIRNRVRNTLLPMLRESFSPNVPAILGRTMQILQAEHEWIQSEAERWLRDRREEGEFENLAMALQREIVRQQLFAMGIPPEFRLVESIRKGPPGDAITVAAGRRICRTPEGNLTELRKENPRFRLARLRVDLSACEQAQPFGGLSLEFHRQARGELDESPKEGVEFFDADAVGKTVWLRHWQPGDRFWPIGMVSSVRLQDWFTNQKIPVEERRCRVLAEAESGDLFWVENLRISERFKLTQATENVLRLTWRKAPEF